MLSLEEIDFVSGGAPAPTVTNMSTNTADTAKVNQAIQILTSNYNNFTTLGQQAADQILHIEIDPASAGRSALDYSTHTLHLNENDVAAASPAYIAGDIMHDGEHMIQNSSANGYQGIPSEQQATQLELDNAQALQLSSAEQQTLQNYAGDATAIQNRINEPVDTSQWGTGTTNQAITSFISPYDLGNYSGDSGSDDSGGYGTTSEGDYGNNDYGDDSDYGYTSVGIV
jgi:hypothetical protein